MRQIRLFPTSATHCHICDKVFKEEKHICSECGGTRLYQYKDGYVCSDCNVLIDDDSKVRDHCHYTGKYRGAAHNSCNINYRKPKFFPVIFHNLSGYDAHLFIMKLGGEISCIASNEEKYISFSKKLCVDSFTNANDKTIEVNREIRFIDSLKFMQLGLESLVRNLSPEQCKNMAQRFDGEQLKMLLRKGVYPYEYMDCFEKLNETKLPPIEKFYSKLKYSGITDDDYDYAGKVWKMFNMKTMRDYHNLYLETDTILLADLHKKL